jgi:TPR repeat protein
MACIGVAHDLDTAAHWLKLAADQGDAVAKDNLKKVTSVQKSYAMNKELAMNMINRGRAAWHFDVKEPVLLVTLATSYVR